MPVMTQFVLGVIFGLGLVISGMADPAKVQNFLDIAGTWDPSLAFVMAGAVGATFIGYRMALRRARPIFAAAFSPLPAQKIDSRIILGPVIFGIGWGLAGFCPGPALTSLGVGAAGTYVFTAAMIAGMAAARMLAARSA